MAEDRKHETILLAEDEDSLLNAIQTILLESGYSVIAAVDGIDALEKANAHKGTIDLLLSDLQMPRKSGLQLAREFIGERPETKVLLMSGSAAGLALPDEAWHFMPKPFTSALLKEKIQQALANKAN